MVGGGKLLQRGWLTAAVLVISGALSAATGPLPAPELAGLEIIRIEIVRHNLFDTADPGTSSWPYRAANSLHMVTRERFIRSALLFHEGDAYDPEKAAESARILRSWGFLNPVEISARPVAGGVEVTVETRDLWTLEVGGELGFFGHRNRYGFSFTETNFLGWGRTVSAEYKSTSERSSWTYSYFDPFLLGSRIQTSLRHEDASDGFADLVRVERPFYELATPRAWGFEWSRDERDDHLYDRGATTVLGRRRHDRWRAWAGLRLPGGGRITRRLTLGYDHRRDLFDDWRRTGAGGPYPTPDDIAIDGVRIGFEQIPDRYLVLTGYRGWSVQEDVALGPIVRAGLTFSAPLFGGDQRRLLFDGGVRAGRRNGGWLLLAEGRWSGRLDPEGARNLRAGLEVVATQLGERGWQARLFVEGTADVDRDVQLTLGTDQGLRGWEPDYFDGSGRAVLSLQYRRLVWREVLHLFSVGVAGFVDSGITWDPRVGTATGGVRHDAGVGLLFDLPHIGISHLLRLDLAFPDDGSGPIVTVTTQALF